MRAGALTVAVIGIVGLAAIGEIHAQTSMAASGSISGVVRTADDAARPVARAIVTAAGSGAPAGRSSVTDADGRFAISGLPAGRYVVTAKKPAYLPAVYGATRPGRTGADVIVTEGQHVADLKISLVHGAAVSGLVRDAIGQPLANAQIAIQRQGPNGLTVAASALSDDRGQYRVFGLAPGDYFVSAVEYSLVQTVAGNMTTTEVDATLERLRRARGGGAPTVTAPPVPTVNLAPVFYPAALSADQATPVRVLAGEDRSGIDITVMFARTATVSGTVDLPPGLPASAATISLFPASLSAGPRVGALPVGRLDLDGKFRFPGINPGRYVLDARVGFMPVDGGPASAKLWGSATVDVMGDDLADLHIALRPLLHVTGKVVVDGNGDALDLSRLRVYLAGPAPIGIAAALAGLARPVLPTGPSVSADGTFDIEISPGTFSYVVAPLPDGWSMRSAIVDGHDALDVPLKVPQDAATIPAAVITLTNRRTSVSGTVQVGANYATAEYSILMFPQDAGLRQSTRRVRALRIGADGRYRFNDVPAGDYLVAAVTDFQPDDLADQRFFDAVQPRALKVKVTEGEDTIQNVRIGG